MMKTNFWLSAMLGLMWAANSPAQVIFTDTFDSSPSSQWSNLRGAWFATNGAYLAAAPQNIPATFTGLPYDLQNFALDVDINLVADGGIWLRCDPNGTNGVLLVTGGHGWGSGQRGGNAGRSLYWHVITAANFNNPPILDEAFNVFTNPGVQSIHLRVEVNGNLYSAFVNGATNATTSLVETNMIYSAGRVGLYDFSSQTFDNVVLQLLPGPGPYTLHIARTDETHADVLWTTNAAGWNLESTAALPSASWSTVTNLPGTIGTNFFVTVGLAGRQFYRLHKP